MTETFETPTIFHVSIIRKKKTISNQKKKNPKTHNTLEKSPTTTLIRIKTPN